LPIGGFGDLPIFRTVFAALISLAVMAAPVGVAMASSQDTAMSDMADCHKTPAKTKDCPCCDTKAQCPGTFCLGCFKLIGDVPLMPEVQKLASAHDGAVEPQKPPDRSFKPPHPPPRA
jgi:hypothetical protein